MALPGVTTVIKDQFYSLTKALAPTGPLVCAIATRNTPTGSGGVLDLDAYRVYNEQQAINAFGAGSPAHRAFVELVAGGATNIAIVALPAGTTDAQIILEGNVNDARGTNVLNLTDTAFNAAQAAQPDIIVPWGRGGHPYDWNAPGATPNVYEYDATPGNNATAPTPLPFGYSADLLSASGQPMAARIAKLTGGITANSYPCFSVLGVRPYVGSGNNAMENVIASELNAYVQFGNVATGGVAPAAGYTGLYNLASSNTLMGDFGPYLAVVSGEIIPVTYPFDTTLNTFDWGYSNGACMFAAQAAGLAPWIAMTGKVLPNVSKVRYNPTIAQVSVIDSYNICPSDVNFNNQPYWVDAPTFSLPGSDYARLSTIRIIFSAVQAVRQLALQYVGQPASLQVQNAFQTAISSTLRGMITLGALNAADFNVSFFPVTNSAEIDLVLTPAFEIRTVILSISVNF